MPGDCLEIKVIKDGKEAAQGIGYLDDGTMVVGATPQSSNTRSG